MTTFRAARVHLGDGSAPTTSFTVAGGAVVDHPVDDRIVDLGNVEVVPGLVDLHADSLSRFEQPRPGVAVPLEHALDAFTTDALLAGVTTAFLCCSIEHDTSPTRSAEHASAVLSTLEAVSSPIDVRVHLRVDVVHDDNVTALDRLVGSHADRIGLVSVMDHTPGRRQYLTEDAWRRAYRALDRVDDSALDRRLSAFLDGAEGSDRRRRAIADIAASAAIPLAAHDDDSVEAVRRAVELGATISEFPVTEDAARAATRAGLGVVVGAPNLWRGGSHGSGLSARTAFDAGYADIVTSDYHLGAMLPGIRAASTTAHPFEEFLRAVTERPARRIGLTDRGALLPGRRADFVALRGDRVVGVWVSGERRLQRT